MLSYNFSLIEQNAPMSEFLHWCQSGATKSKCMQVLKVYNIPSDPQIVECTIFLVLTIINSQHPQVWSLGNSPALIW